MTLARHEESGLLRTPRLLLALLTVTAFANAIPCGFVWLDHWQVESGGLIVGSWADFSAALGNPLGAMPGWEGTAPYARPCVVLLLSLVHSLAGTRPVAYHVTLVLLHLANVLLVYSVLTRISLDRSVAFLAAALFGVDPLQTAAVSWISGIADPLCTLFVLGALRLQLAASGRTREASLARIGAVLCCTLALGTKETALTFPLLLVAMYVLFPDSLALSQSASRAERARAILRAVAPFCVLLIGACVYRLYVLGAAAFGRAVGAVPLDVRVRTVPRLILSYITLPLRLESLTVCDDYALSTRWDTRTVLATAALLAFCIALTRAWRRHRDAAFGVLWMFVGLLPALNLVPILHYRADRFFYFPLIGWSLTVAVLVRIGLKELQRSAILSATWLHRSAAILTLLGLLLLVSLTIRRNAAFVDDQTLFGSTLRVSPFCREARTALGDSYLRAGRYAEAIAEYEQARSPQPGRASYVVMPKVLINLGMAQLGRSDYAAAAAAFGEAHQLQPQLLHPLFGLGIANLGLGQVAAAATWLEQAYALAPDDPDIVLNLALSYDRLDRRTEAARLYRQYLDRNPQGRARAVAERRARALEAAQR